jgi:hypothetical protein
VHPFFSDVSLAPDQAAPPPTVSQYGDTTYYFFDTQDLPLFGPLRTLGVPEPLIDVVEPFFRVLVELGYDRTISPGVPTPARLIPPLDPAKLITDLVAAIGKGATNAAALVGLPSLPSVPAPVTLAGPATQFANADMSPQAAKDAASQTERAILSDTETSTTTDTETTTADVLPKDVPSEEVNGTERPTSPDATDTTDATSVATNAGQPSTGPTSEASASSASTPEPTKPAGEPSKPRPVVRDSLRAGQQFPDPSRRGAGHQPTTRTADVGAVDASGAPSSTASSSRASSSAANFSGGGTSDSDGDGS